MKINCLVKTSLEHDNGFVTEVVAHEVYTSETIGQVMDRLAGHQCKYGEHAGRRVSHDSSIVVELRVAKTQEEQEEG